jgi:2-haloacid dehalogenase
MQKTIAFDIYGTLINTDGILESLQAIDADKAITIMEVWRNKQLEYSFRRGLMNAYVDFSVCTENALEYACIKHDLQLTHAQKKSLLAGYKILPVFTDVISTLENLKREDYKLVAFSNGSRKAIIDLLTNAGIVHYFDTIVSVEDVKTFKPSTVVYDHLLKVTSSEKLDTWLVSSNPFDVIGAGTFGLNTIWVQRSTNTIFDPWEIKPTAIIQKLDQITNQFA